VVAVVFLGVLVYFWWKSREFEPELEDDEDAEEDDEG